MSMTTIIAVLENKGIVSHEEAEKLVHHLDNRVQASNYRDAVYEVRNLLQPLGDPQPKPLNAPVGPEQANEETAARSGIAASATPEQTTTQPDGTTTITQPAGATPTTAPDPDTNQPASSDSAPQASDSGTAASPDQNATDTTTNQTDAPKTDNSSQGSGSDSADTSKSSDSKKSSSKSKQK